MASVLQAVVLVLRVMRQCLKEFIATSGQATVTNTTHGDADTVDGSGGQKPTSRWLPTGFLLRARCLSMVG